MFNIVIKINIQKKVRKLLIYIKINKKNLFEKYYD